MFCRGANLINSRRQELASWLESIVQKEDLDWSGGKTLYSNWIHTTQTVGNPLTFEQCAFKVFETNAPYIIYNPCDGRCICKDSTAIIATSTELSTAYPNGCNSSIATSTNEFAKDIEAIVYPNLTSSEVVLKIENASLNRTDDVKLFSLVRELLYTAEIASLYTAIDMINLQSGLYILAVTVNDESKKFKIFKE